MNNETRGAGWNLKSPHGDQFLSFLCLLMELHEIPRELRMASSSKTMGSFLNLTVNVWGKEEGSNRLNCRLCERGSYTDSKGKTQDLRHSQGRRIRRYREGPFDTNPRNKAQQVYCRETASREFHDPNTKRKGKLSQMGHQQLVNKRQQHSTP
jgi:hypothetical protein